MRARRCARSDAWQSMPTAANACFMVGADPADLERVMPLLQAMGNKIHHCGPGGAGMRMKLVNNYLAIVLCQLNAEALALSQRFGLDIVRTLEVLYGTTADQRPAAAQLAQQGAGRRHLAGLYHRPRPQGLVAESSRRLTRRGVPVPVGGPPAREALLGGPLARAMAASIFSAVVDVLCDPSRRSSRPGFPPAGRRRRNPPSRPASGECRRRAGRQPAARA